ncbi:MAG: adenosylcobinamide-GDP ribazoletransferase [Thermoleophilia bacterium]
MGFFTRLPAGGSAGIDELRAAFPLVPLVGWVTGVAGGVFALGLIEILPPLGAGAVLLAFLVGLTGLNQTDGLADLGDGLMVHGDAERRREVMRDHSLGTGALGLTLFTYLAAFAVLGSVLSLAQREAAVWLIACIVLIEVIARIPYLLLAFFGHPSHSGLGSTFMEGFSRRHLAVGLLVASPAAAGFLVGWAPVLLAGVGGLLVAVVLLRFSARLLGGVGGDVMGASQELARTAAALGLAAGLQMASW